MDILCIAFCPEEITNTTRGNYRWPRTNAEDFLTASCVYGAVNGTSIDKVRRNCSDRGIWIEVELEQCRTFSNSLLRNISSVSTHLSQLLSQSMGRRLLYTQWLLIRQLDDLFQCYRSGSGHNIIWDSVYYIYIYIGLAIVSTNATILG